MLRNTNFTKFILGKNALIKLLYWNTLECHKNFRIQTSALQLASCEPEKNFSSLKGGNAKTKPLNILQNFLGPDYFKMKQVLYHTPYCTEKKKNHKRNQVTRWVLSPFLITYKYLPFPNVPLTLVHHKIQYS